MTHTHTPHTPTPPLLLPEPASLPVPLSLRRTKKRIRAAGVLCYSKDEVGNTWFLLGRERPNPKWGKDSNSWSEFGGSLCKNAQENRYETPEEGAAREFFEESMGVIYGNPRWMEGELKERRYLFTLDSCTPSGKGYRSFVKYIPFVDYPSKFARCRTLAKKNPEVLSHLIPECFRADGRMNPVCMEKTCMSWFSAQQLCNTIEGHQHANDPINPRIRQGFAADFAYLMTTPWGQAGFTDEHIHLDPTQQAIYSALQQSEWEAAYIRPDKNSPRKRQDYVSPRMSTKHWRSTGGSLNNSPIVKPGGMEKYKNSGRGGSLTNSPVLSRHKQQEHRTRHHGRHTKNNQRTRWDYSADTWRQAPGFYDNDNDSIIEDPTNESENNATSAPK